MSVRENLIRAKALISDPEKWIKWTLQSSGCFCVMGAIGKVTRDQGRDSQKVYISQTPEYNALYISLPEGARSVPGFNDLHETTHADIMALFDRAIEASK